MARNKEDIQDRLLHQFEKAAKQERGTIPITFEEQLNAANAHKKMPDHVKLQQMGAGEWQEKVRMTMNKMFHTGNYESEKKMRMHFRKMDEFHQKGTPLSEVATWLEEQYLGY